MTIITVEGRCLWRPSLRAPQCNVVYGVRRLGPRTAISWEKYDHFAPMQPEIESASAGVLHIVCRGHWGGACR
jgi:hypothetical protein